MQSSTITTSTQGTSIADVLERVLDKGVVVAGDIRVKLCDIELLTIQLRLVLCSVERAKEIGLDWWNAVPAEKDKKDDGAPSLDVDEMAARLEQMERQLASLAPPHFATESQAKAQTPDNR